VQLTPPDGANYSLPLFLCEHHVVQESCGVRWLPRRSVFDSWWQQFARHTAPLVIDSSYAPDSDLSASVPHHSSSHTCHKYNTNTQQTRQLAMIPKCIHTCKSLCVLTPFVKKHEEGNFTFAMTVNRSGLSAGSLSGLVLCNNPCVPQCSPS